MPSKNGKFVTCHQWAPKSQTAGHEIDRVTCMFRRSPECAGCPNEEFQVTIQPGIGNHVVACPRWPLETDWKLYAQPTSYVEIRRETCLTTKPFDFCIECPNSDPKNLPQQDPGWIKPYLRKHKAVEKVLQEEDKNG